MKIYMTITVGVASLLFGSPAFAAVNLVQNGGFESGPAVAQNPGFLTIKGNNQQRNLIPNWTVGGNSVDYIRNYWQNNKNSGGSVDLNGDSMGRLSQTITTVVGQLYKIVFYYSANPDGGIFPRQATVGFGQPGRGNAVHTITAFADPTRTRTNMNWRRAEFYRRATDTATLLTFFGDNQGNSRNHGFGIALDSVSVSATPEPAAYASLLVGLGMVGFVARRRKRAMAKAAAAA